MLGMLNAVLLFVGARKWLMYGALAALAVALFFVAYAKVKAKGAAEERAKQLEATLKKVQQDAKDRAAIERLNTDAIRVRLRQRWSAD